MIAKEQVTKGLGHSDQKEPEGSCLKQPETGLFSWPENSYARCKYFLQ